MSWDQIAGPLRAILPSLFAFAVGKGWLGAGSADWIMASIMSLGAAGWSIWANRPAAVAANAQAITGVTVTTTTAAAPSVQASVAAAK